MLFWTPITFRKRIITVLLNVFFYIMTLLMWWSCLYLHCSVHKHLSLLSNSSSLLFWRNGVPCRWEWRLCRSPGLENRKWSFQNWNSHSAVSKNWPCFGRRYVSDRHIWCRRFYIHCRACILKNPHHETIILCYKPHRLYNTHKNRQRQKTRALLTLTDKVFSASI